MGSGPSQEAEYGDDMRGIAELGDRRIRRL
jgi:hypothetical protein